MIVAVVLSAGESSRMGRPKALLPIAGSRFIERIVSALAASRVGRILVVLGHNADDLRRQITDLPVEIIVNPDYKKGQLSSLQSAIRHIEGEIQATEVDGIVVHLVDHPYIDSQVVNLLIDRFYDSGKLIVVPRFRGRRGHPVLFSRKLFGALLAAPMEQGAKSVVHAHRDETLELETKERGVTIDIDTPEEYRNHVKGA